MFNTNKAVSSIVSIALLLVVAVLSVIGFQSWFEDFQSSNLVKAENNEVVQLQLKGLINNKLYIKSSKETKLIFFKVLNSTGEELCKFSDLSENPNFSNNTLLQFTFDSSTYNVTHVKDLSGNDGDGFINGTTHLTENCISDECFDFSGNLDYIQIPHSDNYNDLNEISFSTWVKLSSYDLWKPVMVIRKWTNFGLESRQNKPTFFIASDYVSRNNLAGNVSPPLSIDSWYHLVGTFDNGLGKIYIDGELMASTNFSVDKTSSLSDDIFLGMTGSGAQFGYYEFNGTMDEVSIYSKSLTQGEVLSLYKARKALLYEQIIPNGVKIIDLTSCNLTPNKFYEVVAFTPTSSIQQKVITK